MIIQVRGTSGSGKTYVVRKLLGKDLEWQSFVERWQGKNRRVPLYYLSGDRKIAVCGSYETACGGCDGVGSARLVFELYERLMNLGVKHIVSEGLLLSEDTRWTLEADNRGWRPKVFHLDTEVDVCVEQIISRREEGKTKKTFSPKNTIRRVGTISRAVTKLDKAGVQCFNVSSSVCAGLVLRTIGVQ